MREVDLPSPDTGAAGFNLRRIAAKTISALEVVASYYPNGAHPGAVKLAAFFAACRDAAEGVNAVILLSPITGEPMLSPITNQFMRKP